MLFRSCRQQRMPRTKNNMRIQIRSNENPQYRKRRLGVPVSFRYDKF